ncbi:MAG: SMP-30/gluconolactonase/LRE family protein [Deltaproteobacteria bacterium]|nr:SMP-30/gluconolactonase/LRE family protein [Deltaproteobacteria bacterium]MBI3386464.1 SMP-30/gluconolactonase/LRE family protein [Deltaproteobacteria bacterium]
MTILRRALIVLVVYRTMLSALACAQTIDEFPLPTPNSQPAFIVVGGDNKLWFTELRGAIGRVSPSSTDVITEFPVRPIDSPSAPAVIAHGKGLELWFTDYTHSTFGHVAFDGNAIEYSPLTGAPGGITLGSDGNIWIAETRTHLLARVRVRSFLDVEEFQVNAVSPASITSGPDGNLWFTDSADLIGRVPPTNVAASVVFPVLTDHSRPLGIASGPDGNLWFTESEGNKIGRITITGTVSEYPVPTANSRPYFITAGADGNLWFTENGANKIGRISPSGTIEEFTIPTAASDPRGIAWGPDDQIWFCETAVNKIARVNIGVPTPTLINTPTRTPTWTVSPTLTPLPTTTPTATRTETVPSTATTTALGAATATASASPTASATATPTLITVPLVTPVTVTDTTIAVSDVSVLPNSGTVMIDNEQMTYDGKQPFASASAIGSAAAAQPGVLLNVRRGVNGTMPAAHQAGAIVVLIRTTRCVGDCDGGHTVTVEELVKGVNIALGIAPLTDCDAFDANNDSEVTVEELVTAVSSALNECPSA